MTPWTTRTSSWTPPTTSGPPTPPPSWVSPFLPILVAFKAISTFNSIERGYYKLYHDAPFYARLFPLFLFKSSFDERLAFNDIFTGKKSPVKPIFRDPISSASDMFAMDSDNDLTPKVAPLRERIFDIPNIDD